MAGNSQQVAAGHDMLVYTQPYISTTAMPADTVLWGSSPGGSFVDKGYTREGLRVLIEHQFDDIPVDQQIDPVYSIARSRNFRMGTNLAQISAANLKDATGQGAITSVAAGVARGHDDLDFTSVIAQNFTAVLFDILNPGDGEALRFLAYKTQPRSPINMQFNIAPGASIAYEAQCFPDDSVSPARIAKYRDVTPIVP